MSPAHRQRPRRARRAVPGSDPGPREGARGLPAGQARPDLADGYAPAARPDALRAAGLRIVDEIRLANKLDPLEVPS